MLIDLSSPDRHAAIKALSFALAAMDVIPESRRPKADREAVAGLLAQLDATRQEIEIYDRAADWMLREIATAAALAAKAGAITAMPAAEKSRSG